MSACVGNRPVTAQITSSTRSGPCSPSPSPRTSYPMLDGRTALTGAERKRRYDHRVRDGLIYVRGGLPSVAVLRRRYQPPELPGTRNCRGQQRHEIVAIAPPSQKNGRQSEPAAKGMIQPFGWKGRSGLGVPGEFQYMSRMRHPNVGIRARM